jgi:hypothetical protein
VKQILYRRGYKYQMHVDYAVGTGITGQAAIIGDDGDPWVRLRSDGMLFIRAGYAWDGPSGPTFDTPSFMRASVVHDALYQLMRAGKLPQETREAADELLCRMCTEDGMWKIRAAWCLAGVRAFAAYAAKQKREEVLTAP